jgi:hypothetical protein
MCVLDSPQHYQPKRRKDGEMHQLEKAAIMAWRRSGMWALFTVCTGCGRFTYCRGRTRDRVKCLACFDLGVSK